MKVPSFIKKLNGEVFNIILLIILYFFSRLYHLKDVPYFLDELIYGRWTQQGAYDPELRLVSLVDGKQPLYIWLSTAVMHFIINPVEAGRIVSIIAGFGTAIGLYFLSFVLFKNRWISLVSSLLYILLPFALFINRLGIYESLVGMLLIWSIYGQIQMAKYLRLDIALLLGFILGAGLLTKSTGSLVIALFPLTLFFISFTRKNYKNMLAKWIIFALVATTVAYICSSVMFLSRNYDKIYDKNFIFIYHIQELIPYHAFFTWLSNLFTFIQWLVAYCSAPILILMLFGVFTKKYKKEVLFLGLWFFIPTIWLGLFGRILYARYLYPFIIFMLPLASISLFALYKRFKKQAIIFTGVCILCMSFAVYTDYKILTDLKHAPLPEQSLFRYVNGWPSGEGLSEFITYLDQVSVHQQIYLATEGTYGSIPTLASEIYFLNNTLIDHHPIENLSGQMPIELARKAKLMPVYIFINNTQKIPNWPMELVLEHKKGTGNYYMRLYKIKSKTL